MFRKFTFPTLILLGLFFCTQNFGQESEKPDIIVAKDGSGDFTTVQEAIHSIPFMRKTRTTILIKKGVYKENIAIGRAYGAITLIGEDVENTIITFDNYAKRENRFGEEMGTTGSTSVFIFADDFIAKNITFENSAGIVGQAVAVRVNGDKVTFINCRFLGNQDTLYPNERNSRQYYYKCYIEGTVDYIFGWSTAVFDSCEIYNKREEGGYVTAASTDSASAYGLVFRGCKITGKSEESYYLGRPWRPFAQTVFLNCYMDKSIKSVGWHNWNKPEAEKNSFYAEYKSFGPGAKPEERVEWSHQLTDKQAAEYTLENIFGDWMPEIDD